MTTKPHNVNNPHGETPRSDLVLETRAQEDQAPTIGRIMLTPAVGGDYWAYRVRLSDQQAIVGFPKFTTIGIGFAVEEDWNTNFPYTCSTEEIYDHIEHNKGDDSISREDCLTAIRLIQDAVRRDRARPGGAA
jgi:hypothetical protein